MAAVVTEVRDNAVFIPSDRGDGVLLDESLCRDITTYTLVEKESGRLKRDRWKCDRCERVGVRCLTWVAGGYCNGLARGGEHLDMPLCASCGGRAADIGRGMIGYALMGAVGLIFRRRK